MLLAQDTTATLQHLLTKCAPMVRRKPSTCRYGAGFLVSEHRLCGYQECFSYRENMLVFMQSSAAQRDATSVGSCCSDETPGSHRRLCLGPISRCGCSDTLAPMASTQIEQVRVAILRGLHACPADTAVACVVLLCIASRQLHQQHEDMEMLERAVVYNLDHKPKTVRASALLPVPNGKRLTTTTMHVPAQQRERLLQDHRVKNFVAKINAMSSGLLEKYNDPDGSRAEETAAMKGDEVFKNFYERLTSIRDYHARFPNTGMAKADPAVRFSLPGCVCLARRVVVRSWWRIPDGVVAAADACRASCGASAHFLRRGVRGPLPRPPGVPRTLLQLPRRAP